MEVAISAVTSELVSRFISFLMNKYYSSHISMEGKVKRLQHLLARVHTVVEEADGRYITNSGMLMQLKMFSEDMYRAYRVLDTIRFQTLKDSAINEVSGSSGNLPFTIPLKRSRTISCRSKEKFMHHELQGALESLEIAVDNMTEFVVLLAGCERMSRRPYDAYLYIDNFMFSRHTEKQKLLNFLLQYHPPGDAPAVLPIIGGIAIGKKTLVAHVCGDERVCSHFSSVLHLNGDNLLRILEHGSTMLGIMLVVVEFVSDVDDRDWTKFYSILTRMARGSKVIIISKLQKLARFGSVKPIFLNILSHDEFWYLFKTLAFGSAKPEEHPRLVQIAEEFAKELQSGGSLVATNAFADILRRNLNVQFWSSILNRTRRVIQKNFCEHGVPANLLFQQGHPVDITDFALHTSSPIRIIPCTSSSNSNTNVLMKIESPKMTLGELLVNHTVRPKWDFNLLTWESRIPPYARFAHHIIASSTQDLPEAFPLSGRKRRGVPI